MHKLPEPKVVLPVRNFRFKLFLVFVFQYRHTLMTDTHMHDAQHKQMTSIYDVRDAFWFLQMRICMQLWLMVPQDTHTIHTEAQIPMRMQQLPCSPTHTCIQMCWWEEHVCQKMSPDDAIWIAQL